MLYAIQNSKLLLAVDSLGAQMMHLQTVDGREYLWQGDAAYWPDRAPVLFPFIGRLTQNRYRYEGQEYPMGIHGFAGQQEFACRIHAPDRLVLELTDNPETQKQNPFSFSLAITYQMVEDRVEISYQIENHSETVMCFGIGGHPGFRVPLEEGEQFTDYVLEFTGSCQPDRVGSTPEVYLSGHDQAYPLVEGKLLPLRHDLFDEDAIILKNMSREVTLRSRTSAHGVRVTYPDMPYLGIWHWPKTDAPYACIEPWTSLPARKDIIEDFECKSDMIKTPQFCECLSGCADV